MLDAKWQDFAQAHGLVEKNGALYGVYNGYMLSVYQISSAYAFYLGIHLKEEATAALGGYLEEQRAAYPIITHQPIGAGYSVQMPMKEDIVSIATNFLNDLTGKLPELGALSNICPHCGNEVEPRPENAIILDGVLTPMHADCAHSVNLPPRPENAMQTEEGNYLRGFLGALLGSLIGAIPWAIISLIGFFSGWAGFVIGLGALKGYELFKGKEGKGKVWISLACILFSIVFMHFFTEIIATINEIPGISFSEAFTLLLLALEMNVEGVGSFWLNLLIGLFFGLWGGLGALQKSSQKIAAQNAQPQIRAFPLFEGKETVS